MLAYILSALLAVAPAGGPAATGSLTVIRPALRGEKPLAVTARLYRDDELVQTRELLQYRPPLSLPIVVVGGAAADLPAPRDRSEVTWVRLPEGTYAVQFEARGYRPSFKTVRVAAANGDQDHIYVELDAESARPGKRKLRRWTPARHLG